MKRALLVLLLAASALAANERLSATPQEVFDSMRAEFHADKAAGVHARYQWDISGPQGGGWWVEVNDGKLRMGRGRIAN
ncbi:MAG: hypothetical protein ACJ8KU_11850, partial [Chthoniobacterales bacterium]